MTDYAHLLPQRPTQPFPSEVVRQAALMVRALERKPLPPPLPKLPPKYSGFSLTSRKPS